MVEVGPSDAGPFERVEAVVETGATFSQFPRSLLARMGVRPVEEQEFTLADGRRVRREVAVVTVRLEGRTRPTVCVVGDDGVPSLLGALTLQMFGLAADPVNRRLIPAELYLL
jgi:predicted aspartyl protease